jgi:hypothetical protein
MTCIPLLGPESKGILKRRRQMHKGTETQAAVRMEAIWPRFGTRQRVAQPTTREQIGSIGSVYYAALLTNG